MSQNCGQPQIVVQYACGRQPHSPVKHDSRTAVIYSTQSCDCICGKSHQVFSCHMRNIFWKWKSINCGNYRTWNAKVSVKVVYGKHKLWKYRRTWNAKVSVKVVFGKA